MADLTVPQSVSNASPDTEMTSGMFVAFFSASCRAVESVIAVDMAILGRAWGVANGYVALSRESIRSTSARDLIDLHIARAHARGEETAADTREIVELTRQKFGETYAPLKEAFDARRAKSSA